MRSRLGKSLSRSITLLSLAFLLATVALWRRSFSHDDQLYVLYDPLLKKCEGLFIVSVKGHLTVTTMDPVLDRPEYRCPKISYFGTTISWYSEVYYYLPHRALGFGYGPFLRGLVGVGVPHYALTLLFALNPLLFVWRFAKSRRRSASGCCHACGYDLRASKARCPECGTAIPV